MNSDTYGLIVEGDSFEYSINKMETPHLGPKNDSNKEKQTENFLDKHKASNSTILSNHLYQYSAPIYKQYSSNITTLKPSFKIENQDLLKADPSKGLVVSNSKSNIRCTPINVKTNKQGLNSEVQFQHHNSAAKLIQFQTPSTGGESNTTATSKRKISSKIVPNYVAQSPADSRCESINTEVGIRLRYTPESNQK